MDISFYIADKENYVDKVWKVWIKKTKMVNSNYSSIIFAEWEAGTINLVVDETEVFN